MKFGSYNVVKLDSNMNLTRRKNMTYIIVPTFARVNETKLFIESISKAILNNYLILIIDDHPENITYNTIQESEYIRILTPLSELWWVGSINLGIKTLLNEYAVNNNDIIVFANNDVQIDKDNYEQLYYELAISPNQIIHPRTFNQDNNEVSSGAKILSYFPYITKHPKNFNENKALVNMGCARFLMMTFNTMKQVGYINNKLLQYLGDNDFTLKAKLQYNINTYIIKNAKCILNDTETGLKNHNIKTFKELMKSFYHIKSPNNIKYRYLFIRNFFNPISSGLILSSMTLNSLIKFYLYKIKYKYEEIKWQKK
jgi:GT2 family glycosyltransferase